MSPDRARPRPDLPWLRHRRVQHAHIAYVHPPHAPHPPSAPSSSSLSSPSPSLELGRAPAAPATPRRERPAALPYPRLAHGTTVVLSGSRPTVTLTRLQSGVGPLRVQLARGSAAGDLSMGMICETTDGATHVVQRLGDALATPATPQPLARLVAGPDTVLIDLRQVRRLRRALFYGYSPSVSVLAWDGVVVATTYDGSRLEAPFDLPPLSGTVALLSVYAVRGELVLRAELEPFAGPPEMATQAFGYSYGWLGGRLPVG